MRSKTYIVCLLIIATIVIIVAAVMAESFCKSGCDRPTYDACGECELVEIELCGQQGCRIARTVVLSYEGQCRLATGPPARQWLKKTWWDCNEDDHADCECWTWYLRFKIPIP